MKIKKNGFTLLEVILALFILVSAVTIISNTQFRAIFTLWKGREKIDRVFFIKKDLLDIFFKIPEKQKEIARIKDRPIVTTLENPEIKISSTLLEINKKSSLKNFIDFIDVVKTSGEWKSGTSNMKIEMLAFVQKEKEEKS